MTDDEREALIAVIWDTLSDSQREVAYDLRDAILASDVWRFRRTSESDSQGAEEDAQEYIARMKRERPDLSLDDLGFVDVPEPQGEPSDAQVEIAWRTWLGLGPDEAVMGNWIHEARMKARAVLRAASAVTEQGENRGV